MTAAELKDLKKGVRVYWRGDADDSGVVTGTSWEAVTIAWNNGLVATVHHGDMREVLRTKLRYSGDQRISEPRRSPRYCASIARLRR
jgi:hypothetical protein